MARLLDTKLQPPPLRTERVYRPGIYAQLAGFHHGVVVVSAPPGFGKSTLVAEWLTEQSRPSAWYSLDRYDGDVGLFGEYLASAVRRLTGTPSGLVSLPGERTPDPRMMIATLADDLAAAPAGSVLVLDDYHEVQSADVHDVVNYLVDNLPDGLVLAIVTRADPPLPLSRLRSRDMLREIRGADLRFTARDVDAYFNSQGGFALDADQVDLLLDRSEGWVSALQLVSLGLGSGESTGVTTALTAHHPYIAGYLVDEVLNRLPPDLTRFLLHTSPFERFDAQLCRDAAGEEGAAEALREIERRNAFLIPLGTGGEWYRYHHLFAELLRSRLQRTDPDRYAELLNDAAVSCERRGLLDDAIGYALEAGNVECAAQIVDRNIEGVIGAGEVPRLRSWLRSFPVPAGAATNVVALGWAWCRIFEGDLDAASELIDRIEIEHLDGFDRDRRGELAIMRAMVAYQAGDPRRAAGHAETGLELLPPTSVYVECLGHLYLGRALHAEGKRDEARVHLERAASLAGLGNTLAGASALFWLGVVEMDAGNLTAAERSMLRAREVGRAAGESSPATGVADIGLAYIRLNQLAVDDAVRLGERGTRLLERSTFVEMVFRAFFVWAEALSVAGEFDDSTRVCEEGIEWLRGRSIAGGPLETWLMMVQTRNSWRNGKLDEAGAILNRVRRRGLGSPNQDESLGFYEAADAISYALRCGDAHGARELMSIVPDPQANVMFAIKLQVLDAALHEIDGNARAAVASLEKAVELAESGGGWRYQFSHVEPVIRPVLGRMVGRSAHDDFVRTIIDRLPLESNRAPAPLADPLTDRELDVLAEIAAGYTNDQIADRLFISRGTVKRHASNIYMKLGAHHRAEAAARARELGLID